MSGGGELSTLRGQDLRDRLVASRLAVRDCLAAHPSVALRDEIQTTDHLVCVSMRAAIITYEAIAEAYPVSPPVPPPDDQGVARGDPPPRRVASARPVPPT